MYVRVYLMFLNISEKLMLKLGWIIICVCLIFCNIISAAGVTKVQFTIEIDHNFPNSNNNNSCPAYIFFVLFFFLFTQQQILWYCDSFALLADDKHKQTNYRKIRRPIYKQHTYFVFRSIDCRRPQSVLNLERNCNWTVFFVNVFVIVFNVPLA